MSTRADSPRRGPSAPPGTASILVDMLDMGFGRTPGANRASMP